MAEAAIRTARNYKELAEKWAHKYHKTLQENREALQGLAVRGGVELVGLGVGLLDGVSRGLWGDAQGNVEIQDVDVHIGAAVLVNGAALLGLFGEASQWVAVAGACMSTVVTSRASEKFVRASVTK